MFDKFALTVAIRYFQAKKNERFVSIISAISFIGIMIGVAALIVVMSVMNGFHIELTKSIVGLNGDIVVAPIEKTITNYPEVLKQISAQKFVKKATPIIAGQAFAISEYKSGGVIIKGIDLEDLKAKDEIVSNSFEGSFADYSEPKSVAVGYALARNLGLLVGSQVKLISPNIISTAFGSMPRTKDFTVTVIFSSGNYEYDAATILMPLANARKFLALGDSVNQVEVNITDSEYTKEATKILKSVLGSKYFVSNWLENNAQFLNALKVERTAMFVILSLIIVVAAFNIIASLFMVVKDKTKDIAILKTIGASSGQITAIFIINGLFAGLIGTCAGVVLGLLIAYNVERIRLLLEKFSGVKIFDPLLYFLYSLPSVVRLSDVVAIGCFSLFLSFIATIYPAYRASKLNPVEAMRYE